MREVLRGAMTAFPLRGLGAALAFFLNVVLARVVGAEDMGVYYLALTITTVASTIGTLGLGNVLVRQTAAGAAQDDWSTLKATAVMGTRMSLLCAAAVTILLAVAAPWLAADLMQKPELAVPLQWMALTIIPQTQMQLHAQLLRGLKKIALSQVIRNIDIPLLTMIFIAVLGGTYGASGAAWSFTLANVIAAVMASWMWRRTVGPGGSSDVSVSRRDLLRHGFPILQTNLINLSLNPATTLMLGAMSTSISVAIFAVAFRTAMLTRFALMSVNSIAGPKFAELHGTADRRSLASTSRRSAFLITLVAAPLFLFIVIFPGWTMGLFGEAFVEGANVLVILALGQFIAAICGSVGYLLMMSGNEKALRNNTLVSGLFSLVLNLILIPSYGVIGAAISGCTAMVIRSILGTIQVYRHLGILPFFVRAPSEDVSEA